MGTRILILFCSFVICCRYPKNDILTLSSVDARLEGQWKVVSFVINGISTVPVVRIYYPQPPAHWDTIVENYCYLHIWNKKDIEADNNFGPEFGIVHFLGDWEPEFDNSFRPNPAGYSTYRSFSLSKNKKEILFYVRYLGSDTEFVGTAPGAIGMDKYREYNGFFHTDTFTILKLTKNDFWIQAVTNGTSYEVHYKKLN